MPGYRPTRAIYKGSPYLPPDGWCVREDFPPADCSWCGMPTVAIDRYTFGCVDCDELAQLPYTNPAA